MVKGWTLREGETPYPDLDGFKHTKKYPQPSRNLVDEMEEENVRKATLKYLASVPSAKKAPFTYEWLLRLHREMYGDVWDWAGQTRTQNTQIGVDKHQIVPELAALVHDLQEWPQYFDPIEMAARLHHKAVQIHPFKNGNGRWSRLLANIWLKQQGMNPTEWPSITGESPIRDDYLKAVRAADNLDYEPLIALHRKFTKA